MISRYEMELILDGMLTCATRMSRLTIQNLTQEYFIFIYSTIFFPFQFLFTGNGLFGLNILKHSGILELCVKEIIIL